MQRYWRLIAIAAVVILTIGTFYIQSALAKRDLPEVTIETVSGDADEMNPVEISGDYNTENRLSEIQIDKTGAAYSSEQSLLAHLASGVYPKKIQELQEDYRGFMRGKSGNLSSYMEAENSIAYADVINQTVSRENEAVNEAVFDMAALNKDNGETTSFTVPVPDRNKYRYLFIEDVQKSGDELIVITRNTLNGGGKEEEHIYRVDIEKESIKRDETVLSSDHAKTDKGTVRFRIQLSNNETAPRQDILFQKTREIPVSDGDQANSQAQQIETETDGYVTYDLKTGKTEKLEAPEALQDQTAIGRNDTTLYFRNEKKVTAYNFEKEEITYEFDLPASSSASSAKNDQSLRSVVRIKGDKAYFLTQNEEAPQRLFVFDLTSGDTLFEGRFIFDELSDKASVQLYNLTVN